MALEPGGSRPPLVIGCGALAPELVSLTRRAGLPPMDLACLPATLHNRPERIPGLIRSRIRRARAAGYDRIFVAYADCGTGGLLDRVLEAEGVDRLEGAHCYEVFAGRAAFAALSDAEPGTFYLTDFLARNFERLVIRGLGLDHHPELQPLYFGNYRRLVFLAQTDDPALTALACRGARRLGLAFERRFTGLGGLERAIGAFASGAATRVVAPRARVAPRATVGAVPSIPAPELPDSLPWGQTSSPGSVESVVFGSPVARTLRPQQRISAMSSAGSELLPPRQAQLGRLRREQRISPSSLATGRSAGFARKTGIAS